MANNVLTRGKLNEVFFRFGVWGNESKRHRFVHAPFDRVEIDGEAYLNTRSLAAANGGADIIPHIATVSVTDDEDSVSARDLFFTELNPLTMEDHQMGNWRDHGEDWTGMHQLGFI